MGWFSGLKTTLFLTNDWWEFACMDQDRPQSCVNSQNRNPNYKWPLHQPQSEGRCEPHLRWIKVKLSLCLTKHYAMKTYWGVDVELHAFFTSALGGRELALDPGGKSPRYTLVRGVGGRPRFGMDAGAKRIKIINAPAWDWTPVVQHAASSLQCMSYPVP